MRMAPRRATERGGEALNALTEWARKDPRAEPLVRLQIVALRAGDEANWVAEPTAAPATNPALPLLHERRLAIDAERLRALLLRMVEACDRQTLSRAAPLRRALREGTFDARALVEAEINGNADGAARAGAAAAVEPGLLNTLAQLAARPLLTAYARRAEAAGDRRDWEWGYCPICAAWPLLAEIRGLDKQRWLRCGRCTASWRYELQRCVFCGNRDFRTLGYLATDETREARQATTCDQCRGYLKGLTTLGAMSPAELALEDLKSLDLDLAALERGYARPAAGFPLQVQLIECKAHVTRQ